MDFNAGQMSNPFGMDKAKHTYRASKRPSTEHQTLLGLDSGHAGATDLSRIRTPKTRRVMRVWMRALRVNAAPAVSASV